MSTTPFHEFPYTNFHDLNLDWIIGKFNSFEQQLTDFVSLATIKYANPIQWDITHQYETNTVVVDSNGNAYLSVRPVPAGVSLDRTEYWTKIGNFDELWSDVKKAISPIDEGHYDTASEDRAVNTLAWSNNDLLRVTRAMKAGDRYIVGENCVVSSTNEVVQYIVGLITQETADREDADTELDQKITQEATDREAADNALDQKITQEATDREAADNALDQKITQEATDREAADNALEQKITQETDTLNQKITEETADRENADTQLQVAITANISAQKAIKSGYIQSFIDQGYIPPDVNIIRAAVSAHDSVVSLPDAITAAQSSEKPVIVLLEPGTYDIYTLFPPATNSIGMVIPDNCYLVGTNKDTTILTATSNTGTLTNYSTVNVQKNGGCFNLTIYAKQIRYCVHDDFNASPVYPEMYTRVFCNVKLTARNLKYTSVYGAGFHSGNKVILDHVTVDAPGTQNAFYFHSNYTSGDALSRSEIVFKNCDVNCPRFAQMQAINSEAHGEITWTFNGGRGFVFVDQPAGDKYAHIFSDSEKLYFMGVFDIAKLHCPNVMHIPYGNSGTKPLDQDVVMYYNNEINVARLVDRTWKKENILGINIGTVGADNICHVVTGGIWDTAVIKNGGVTQQTFIEYDTNCNLNKNVGITATDYSIVFINQSAFRQCIF